MATIANVKNSVFHIGSVGDTLVNVPALRVVRENFPDAHITMLSDIQNGEGYVQASEVLAGSSLVDSHLSYKVERSWWRRVIRPARMIGLLLTLRRRPYDALVYLIRSDGRRRSVPRDMTFFRLAGIKRFIAHEGYSVLPQRQMGKSLPMVPHQTDQILARLRESGLNTPSAGKGEMDLRIGDVEHAAVDHWIRCLPPDEGRRWIGVAPGSKMPAKIWPLERYAFVVRRLIADHDIWPVVFGGEEDQNVGKALVKDWGRGYVAAGNLGIREAIAALQRCRLYLGNDTGTMHMAVAANIPCIGIFSSRDYPGNWYPYGEGHIVFRTPIACEGCMLERCVERRRECLLSIHPEEVHAAAAKVIQRRQSVAWT